MYNESPMERFNRNNPFVMMAKHMYDNIVDTIHSYGKSSISNVITSSITLIMMTFSVYLVALVRSTSYIIPSVIMIFIVAINVTFAIGCYKNIQYFMIDHKAMKNFTRLSKLEVNEILAMNNEDMLKCVHELYQEYGELITVVKFYNKISKCINICEFIIFIISMVIISLS